MEFTHDNSKEEQEVKVMPECQMMGCWSSGASDTTGWSRDKCQLVAYAFPSLDIVAQCGKGCKYRV